MIGMTRLPVISGVFQMRRPGVECSTTQLRGAPQASDKASRAPRAEVIPTRATERSPTRCGLMLPYLLLNEITRSAKALDQLFLGHV